MSTPSGTVSFTSMPTTGVFGSSGSCSLQASGTTGKASCLVAFTPAAAGGYTITGSYGGDSGHGSSHGAAEFPVLALPGVLTINGRAEVSRHGVVAVTLICKGGSGASCAGTLTLTTTVKTKVTRKVKGRNKTVIDTRTTTLGFARYAVAAGVSERLRIALSKADLRLFDAAAHNLKAKATAKPATGAATTKTITLS